MAALSEREPLVMFQDEARFGRISIPRNCWAPAPMRPVVFQQAIREYTYVYGAFAPMEGIADTFILPDMYTTTMSVFLDEISKRHPHREILMVMDGAPCHTSGTLSIPENMHRCVLPPYSPECNPSENMWDELREKYFSNNVFNDMSALKRHLITALTNLDANPKTVQGIAGRPWIIKELVPI